MSEILRPAWDKIIGENGLVETHWPEVEISMTADQTDRFNWREILDRVQRGEDLGFNTPFVVMQVAPAIPSTSLQLATGMQLDQPIALHYIRETIKTEDEEATEDTIAEIILDRCETMRDILWAGGLTDFQVLTPPMIDVGDNNPANLIFLEAGHPLQAGTVNFVATVWQ